MSVKKNFVFNSILLVSQYIIPLIIFPYISRIFGVEKLGLVNFVDSIVNYFILFSTLGLTLTGIRETAKYKNDSAKLNKSFTELFLIHLAMSAVVLIVYIFCIFYFDKFKENQGLYFIGASKLIFNLFLIEWFFRGIENFKFITIRSILIKLIYVALLFLFVKNKDDYSLYFALTCGMVIVNGIVNFWYAKSYVAFTIKRLDLRRHFKGFFTIGLYLILNSMYTTFSVAYLGIVADNVSVGYYTTSLKIYTIVLGLFTALNTVLVPRLSSLIAEKNEVAFMQMINKSILFVSTFCFPVIMCGMVLAPEIINILSGPGYDGAILCFRIILPLIFIVGIAQIFSNQILMSLNMDKELAITSLCGAVLGISLNIFLVSKYKEVGTSVVILVSEFCVTAILYYYCVSAAKFKIKFAPIINNFLFSIPYLIICQVCVYYLHGNIQKMILSVFVCTIYFFISQVLFLKNELIVSMLLKFKLRYQK